MRKGEAMDKCPDLETISSVSRKKENQILSQNIQKINFQVDERQSLKNKTIKAREG